MPAFALSRGRPASPPRAGGQAGLAAGQEFPDAAERLVPAIGQVVMAALVSMELHDLGLPAAYPADPGLALLTPTVDRPA